MTRLPQGAGGFDMNSMMKQVQQMQADMAEAQEKLKDEVVEASAGGGMVKVKMSGDLRLLELVIDPDAIDPEDAEMLSGHGPRRGQRGAPLGPGARRRAGSAAPTAALGRRRRPRRPRPAGPLGRGRVASPACTPQPIQRLIAELAKLPGIGQRTAQRLAFHILRAERRRRVRARRRDPRGQGEGRAVRGLLQPRRGPALPDLRGRPPRPRR